ncbi:MAG: L-serine ammonia-lyase, iron-sulfur-dependent, subunit alpha [Treponema sp.]|nr:L-serine ammonia-lyase, iron-sulfur-dependent, subunit alpha [Treponema sp.]
MKKTFYPDFFNDVFGPIMQPGSSSNFAGMSRVARIARNALGEEPTSVTFFFNPDHENFINLGNMMEDRGLLGGILDYSPDDERLFSVYDEINKRGITYAFRPRQKNHDKAGSITIKLTGKQGARVSVTAESIGGGMVSTYDIQGYPVEWKADTHAILVFGDNVNKSKADSFMNMYEDHVVAISSYASPEHSGNEAFFLEFDEPVQCSTVKRFFTDAHCIILPALLPVVTTARKKPQLFQTVEEWRTIASEKNISFCEAAILYEQNSSGWERQRILDYFETISQILDRQIHSLEIKGIAKAEATPLLPIYGKNWYMYKTKKSIIQDSLTEKILDYAFAVNAKLPGFKIVPGPMGTGGGYLFSALKAVQEKFHCTHEKLIESLIVAAALGAIAYTHCHATGLIGCAGESGVCCAMASGAITWLMDGNGKQVEHAASMALQAHIGLTCDPIPGGLEFPCLTRTLRTAVTAPLYADLALSDIDPLVPYHEALQAMELHWKNAKPGTVSGPYCGLRCTETSRTCQQFLKKQMEGRLR